ncbi:MULTISPECIES: hypothetical protein [Microbacterium]|uniref:hypothetical protein n=1 Tax=Microbacterium TaxID=33882 RepID=UPI00285FF4B1|nr:MULTISPECIES: hypothetical protein [Microbacterium]MDR7110874.1 hypothetical protein [Microbacterium trichothecenolyticum]MDT0143243.1 hypothetical protein [Microbacterium sp. PRC9]
MTTTTPNWDPIMIDRAQAEAARWRIAVSAFEYYPEKHLDEPGYTIDEDVAWCIAPLTGLPDAELDQMRATILTLITTPTADRQAFIRHLAALTADDPATDGP